LDCTKEQLAAFGETYIQNAEVQARAAQMLAEMLGLVCHREYFADYPDQMVKMTSINRCPYTQVFVMHLSGVKVSFYWAVFPTEYLQTVRLKNLCDVQKLAKVTLHHTQPRSLINPKERDEFIKEFLSIVRCLADGEGRIGFLRSDKKSPIHKVDEDLDTGTQLSVD